jgi:hypothetical protein
VDLHRTQFVVCTRWENGEQEIRQWRIGELPKFVEQLCHEDQIALARKLVKIVYDTLKNQWVFEDFPSFTLAKPSQNNC